MVEVALENGKTQAHMQCLQHNQTYPPAHITNNVESLFPLEAEKGAAEAAPVNGSKMNSSLQAY